MQEFYFVHYTCHPDSRNTYLAPLQKTEDVHLQAVRLETQTAIGISMGSLC
jgi:hypothetical protein